MSAADQGFYTEEEFRARVTSCLRFPQYDGLIDCVATALSEAIDGGWRIKRMRRMVAEYGLKLSEVLAWSRVTVEEIREYNATRRAWTPQRGV